VAFQHPRKLIRHAAAALMLGSTPPVYPTPAGPNVYRTRFLPVNIPRLPAICVYTLATSTIDDSWTTAPRKLQHQVDLFVEVLFRLGAPADPQNPGSLIVDLGDAMAFRIEAIMAANPTLNGTCGDCWLTGTDWEEMETRDAKYAALRLNFAAYYERYFPHADDVPALDDFLTADVRTRPNSVIPDDEAHDIVSLPGP